MFGAVGADTFMPLLLINLQRGLFIESTQTKVLLVVVEDVPKDAFLIGYLTVFEEFGDPSFEFLGIYLVVLMFAVHFSPIGGGIEVRMLADELHFNPRHNEVEVCPKVAAVAVVLMAAHVFFERYSVTLGYPFDCHFQAFLSNPSLGYIPIADTLGSAVTA